MSAPGLRIVLATFGSLGDLHPYLAVAQELAARGHRPVVATTDVHADATRAAGIEFAPVRPSGAQVGEIAAVVRRLFHPLRGPEYLIRELVMPHLRAAYDDLMAASAGADVLVGHPLTMTIPLVAAKRGLPWASTVLSPLSLLSAIDPPTFAAAPWLDAVRRLGVGPYRTVFGLVKRVAGRWEAPLVRLRAELGLPAATAPALFEGQYSPRLNLALFSAVLAEPQADWPPNTVLCGFPRFDDGMLDAPTAARLRDFLAAGAPPVVFTLGSSVAHAADDFFEKAAAAARRLGCRALLVTGADPSVHASITDAKQVLAFRYLPYPAVFPHAAVNVHQAGIGTLAQALAAGRPQLILPVAFDQPDNARRAVRCGVGRTLPWKQVSVDRLTDALAAILSDDSHRRRAIEVARVVREERAAEVAAGRIVALAQR